MKKVITYKLMRKCLILAFMIIGLVYVASSDRYAQPVAAAPCCETCIGSGDPGNSDTECTARCGVSFGSCYDSCMRDASDCYRHCVYCNGGPPGGDCNSSADCFGGQFCGADNQCHYF